MKKIMCLAAICLLVSSVSLAGCGETPYTPRACVGVGECKSHYTEYHSIPGQIMSLVEQGTVEEYAKTHKGQNFNIVSFVQEMQISKADFMRAMGITEENKEKFLPDTAIPDTIIANEYVEAIYGKDAKQIDEVFVRPKFK